MARRRRNGDMAKRQHWGELVDRWQQSGQSVREFCRDAGVKEAAFYWWRRTLARCRRGRGGDHVPAGGVARRPPAEVTTGRQGRVAARFLPVQVVVDQASRPSSGVEIHWDNGRTVRLHRGFDRQTLVDALAVLEARPC